MTSNRTEGLKFYTSSSHLPIFHACSQAVASRGGHVLHRQLAQAAGHHRHSTELAFGPQTWAVGVLSVQSVLGAAANSSVVRAHKWHLHADGEPPQTGCWCYEDKLVLKSPRRHQCCYLNDKSVFLSRGQWGEKVTFPKTWRKCR